MKLRRCTPPAYSSPLNSVASAYDTPTQTFVPGEQNGDGLSENNRCNLPGASIDIGINSGANLVFGPTAIIGRTTTNRSTTNRSTTNRTSANRTNTRVPRWIGPTPKALEP